MAAEAGTVTVAMVAAAAVEVGTAMTVVGMVTGNQTLTKWGGAISLAGGVGGLAAGAMSGTASAASSASTAADASTSTLGSAGIGAAPDALPDAIDAGGGWSPATGAGDAATANAAAAGGQGIVGDAAAGAPDITAPDATAPVDPNAPVDPSAPASNTASPTDVNTPAGSTGTTLDASGNPVSQQVALNGDTPAAGGAVQTPASAMSTPTGVQTPMGNTQPTGTSLTGSGGSPNPNVNPTDVRLASGTQTPPISSSNYWDKMMGVLQNPQNKTILEMGSKLVGGALQGAQGQAQFNAKMDLENRRLAQTSYGSQVAQNKPHGIIAGARK